MTWKSDETTLSLRSNVQLRGIHIFFAPAGACLYLALNGLRFKAPQWRNYSFGQGSLASVDRPRTGREAE